MNKLCGNVTSFWASLIAQLVNSLPAVQETWFDFWVRKVCWRRDRLPTPVFWPGEFLVAQLVKNQLAVWETWVQSLVWEDPLEKGRATYSTILAWRIPWGCQELDMTERLSLSPVVACTEMGLRLCLRNSELKNKAQFLWFDFLGVLMGNINDTLY